MFRATIDIRGLTDRFGKISSELNAATSRALNFAAFDTRAEWAKEIPKVFDRPTALTTRAPLYKKSRPDHLVAEVFIRDDVSGGTPPVRYLAPNVFGGPRPQKPFERALSRFNARAHSFYVPGKGARPLLDAHGNLPGGLIRKVMSQLGAAESVGGFSANESATTRARRLRRQRKKGGGGSYFILPARRGRLPAGVVFERIETGFGSSVRSVLYPVSRAPRYHKTLNVFALTDRIFLRLFREKFAREMRRIGAR